jgi:hypothetical protein
MDPVAVDVEHGGEEGERQHAGRRRERGQGERRRADDRERRQQVDVVVQVDRAGDYRQVVEERDRGRQGEQALVGARDPEAFRDRPIVVLAADGDRLGSAP